MVLTSDVHRNWPNDLEVDYKDPVSPVVLSELVYSSITSNGNGPAPPRSPPCPGTRT